MLQYLINTSAVWLISLLMFDLFLKKESYHSYNRFYLLFTFLLGGLLPLWQWQDTGRPYAERLQRPWEEVIAAKRNIVSATAPGNNIDWGLWIGMVYLAGAGIAFTFLLMDVFKMVRLFHSGKRSVQNTWTIIETGKEHAPFSFLNTLFVRSRQQYSDEEWQMILVHEQRHRALLHFADLLLLQMTRIIFWFHPLVYVYNRRLLLVHEYQADKVSAKRPQAYGKFLVEQALLQSAPAISHSFNRSPIKKRIVMLTRRSTALSKGKMALFMPLALVCIFCFSKNSFSKKFDKKGNIVTYRRNTFEYGEKPRFDTFTLVEPVTGKTATKVTKRDPLPEKMNGNKIYSTDELTAQPQSYAQNGSLVDHVFRKLSKDFGKLPDGTFRLDINNIIIDEHGKIVYYEGIGLCRATNNDAYKMKEAIANRIDEVLNNAPNLKPGKVGKNNVAVLSDISFMMYEVEVKDHQATIRQVWK
jgi:hypothetical protein